jgi:hypothetical protein
LKGVPGIAEVQLFGDRLNAVVTAPERDIPLIERAFAAAGLPVLQARALAPSLENVFISVTQSGQEGQSLSGTVPSERPGGLS